MTIKEFFDKASEMLKQIDFDAEHKGVILMTIEPSSKGDPSSAILGLKCLGETEGLTRMVHEHMERLDDIAAIFLSASAAYMDGDTDLQREFFETLLENCSCPACVQRRATESLEDLVKQTHKPNRNHIN